MHERLIGAIRIERDASARRLARAAAPPRPPTDELIAEGGIAAGLGGGGREHGSRFAKSTTPRCCASAPAATARNGTRSSPSASRATGTLDEHELATLLEALKDSERFGELLERLQSEEAAGDASISARAAALVTLVQKLLEATVPPAEGAGRGCRASDGRRRRVAADTRHAARARPADAVPERGAGADCRGRLDRVKDETRRIVRGQRRSSRSAGRPNVSRRPSRPSSSTGATRSACSTLRRKRPPARPLGGRRASRSCGRSATDMLTSVLGRAVRLVRIRARTVGRTQAGDRRGARIRRSARAHRRLAGDHFRRRRQAARLSAAARPAEDRTRPDVVERDCGIVAAEVENGERWRATSQAALQLRRTRSCARRVRAGASCCGVQRNRRWTKLAPDRLARHLVVQLRKVEDDGVESDHAAVSYRRSADHQVARRSVADRGEHPRDPAPARPAVRIRRRRPRNGRAAEALAESGGPPHGNRRCCACSAAARHSATWPPCSETTTRRCSARPCARSSTWDRLRPSPSLQRALDAGASHDDPPGTDRASRRQDGRRCSAPSSRDRSRAVRSSSSTRRSWTRSGGSGGHPESVQTLRTALYRGEWWAPSSHGSAAADGRGGAASDRNPGRPRRPRRGRAEGNTRRPQCGAAAHANRRRSESDSTHERHAEGQSRRRAAASVRSGAARRAAVCALRTRSWHAASTRSREALALVARDGAVDRDRRSSAKSWSSATFPSRVAAESMGKLIRQLEDAGVERIVIDRGVQASELSQLVQTLGGSDAKDATKALGRLTHIRVGRLQVEKGADAPSGDIATYRRLYDDAVSVAETLWDSAKTEGKAGCRRRAEHCRQPGARGVAKPAGAARADRAEEVRQLHVHPHGERIDSHDGSGARSRHRWAAAARDGSGRADARHRQGQDTGRDPEQDRKADGRRIRHPAATHRRRRRDSAAHARDSGAGAGRRLRASSAPGRNRLSAGVITRRR